MAVPLAAMLGKAVEASTKEMVKGELSKSELKDAGKKINDFQESERPKESEDLPYDNDTAEISDDDMERPSYDDELPEDSEDRPQPGDLHEPYKSYMENGKYDSVEEMCNDLGLNEYDVYYTEDEFEDYDSDEDEESSADIDTSDNNEDNSSEPRTPENNGQWDGERGDSKWIPDEDYVPPEKSKSPENPYSNPDNLSWGEIMEKYGIDGISFKDGFPDFSEVSKGNVEIDGFETGGNVAKNHNFAKADIALAEQKGCSPEEVKKWREDNNYTWHECEDKKTMQKVPNEIHANIPHDGGRSQKD